MTDLSRAEQWARTAPPLALKEIADEMPGRHSAKRDDVVDWLIEHDPDLLIEMWLRNHPVPS